MRWQTEPRVRPVIDEPRDLTPEPRPTVPGLERSDDGLARLRLLPSESGSDANERRLDALALSQDREGRHLVRQLTANGHLATFISGLPGTGKSTLLQQMVLDDIRAGRNCCVLDPHGDLIRAIIARLPPDEDVLRRVVLFDPSDTDWPMGIDLMDARTERARELAVQFMIDLFEELFLPDHQGPMLHQSVRNGMRLLMETSGSLAELPLVFSDTAFLKKKLHESRDPWVRHYFEDVWLEVKGSSRGEYLAYFTSKLSCFLDDLVLRNILGQRGGLDFGSVLDQGGIVLADLSRGAVGETDSRLLGMILLHKLERFAVERTGTSPAARPRVHVYVDEFHEFATRSLGRFLGAARKFNVGLTLAQQRLGTLAPLMRESILGSVGHVILFRQAPEEGFDALPRLVWPRFGDRELLSLPNYSAVARVTGHDGRRQLGRLQVPRPGFGTDGIGTRVQFLTHARFARPRDEVEKEILDRLGWSRDETDRRASLGSTVGQDR